MYIRMVAMRIAIIKIEWRDIDLIEQTMILLSIIYISQEELFNV